MSSSSPTNPGNNGAPRKRGRLQLFLGYAAGVGKTYRMLEEAQHLQRQGKDVVIGYFEPHGRKETIAKTIGLEFVPTKAIDYRGVKLKEMDTAAIQSRHPELCVVDELAHTNVPGSGRAKRWEDVQILLDAGINILTNMNVQHLESLNDQVFDISGVRVRETVPDWFVKSADEVVMVDATTGALLNRLRRGDIYAPEKAQQAMENFFKESTLSALRELTLRQAAHELEVRDVAETSEESKALVSGSSIAQKESRDRILIYVTAEPSTAMLLRRGRRRADYLGADCLAVCVLPPAANRRLYDGNIAAIERHMSFAKRLHIEAHTLEGNDPAETLVEFARQNQVTQILLNRPRHRSWTRLLGTDLILRIVEKAKDIRLIVVGDRRRKQEPHPL